MVTVGAGYLGVPPSYDLIYDRISHDYPYYRYLLKAAVACGTYVIPNPLLWSADDKYLGFTVAADPGADDTQDLPFCPSPGRRGCTILRPSPCAT